MSGKLSDVEMAAWQGLLHAHHQVVRTLDAELRKEHGITFGEYDVLLRLARAPERRLRMQEVAARVMITPSGVTRAMDGLEARGLVTRSRDTTDARVVYAQLTPDGLERIRAASRTHLRGIREHFTGRLTTRQLRALATALETITGPHIPH